VNRNSKSSRGVGVTGFVVRLVGALVLVLVTYNPSGHSAWHWITEAIAQSQFGPVDLILLAVLLIGWAVFWIASWRALGVLGVVLVAVLIGALVWLLVDIGWINTESDSMLTWIMLVAVAVMLAIGVSWSHFWRRLTGQYNVEDIND
jgi:hypothetical protein